jgi:hypothetical protein
MFRLTKSGNPVGNEHDAQSYIRAGQARSGLPLNLNVDAVEKPIFKKLQISVENLTSQNRVHATNCPPRRVRVPPYLPRPQCQGLFLQPR